MSLRLRTLLVLAIVSLAAAACTAPTLPLPPPVAEVSSPTTQGLVHVEGSAREDADVFVYNDDTESGVIGRADEDGNYGVFLEAQGGDTLLIWYQVGTDQSEHAERTVPARP